MRQKPDGRWLRFTATEEFRVDRVGFSWRARFPITPLVWLNVVDEFEDDHGALTGRVCGRVPVMSVSGPQAADAQAQRYLSELFWCPWAMLANDSLDWETKGNGTVAVSCPVGDHRVGVDLVFDEAGDVAAARTEGRFRSVGDRQILTPWSGVVGGYERIGAARIPRQAEVGWDLPEGHFTYWQGTVTSLEVVSAS